jgi:hypothetical protein
MLKRTHGAALLLGLLMAGVATAAAAGETGALESLEPSTALSAVQSMQGVVFVDLYAEW